jgi:molybdate transport system substrate-binding protein
MRRYPAALLAPALMLLIGMTGCAAPASEGSTPLTVFAAASLTDAFGEIGAAFTAATGTPVRFNFAGSNQLATQITQGAPADVFASANEAQMAALDPDHLAGTPVVFTGNRLVIIVPAENPAGLSQPQDLARPGVLLVLAAPEVPVGQYARAFLDRATADPAYGPDFRAAVLANLVSSEANVRAVLTKVALGEADAGIVYTSDVAGVDGTRVGRIPIPDIHNAVAVYPIAPLAESRLPEQAQAFVAFVRGPEGQAILARHGFSPVTAP